MKVLLPCCCCPCLGGKGRPLGALKTLRPYVGHCSPFQKTHVLWVWLSIISPHYIHICAPLCTPRYVQLGLGYHSSSEAALALPCLTPAWCLSKETRGSVLFTSSFKAEYWQMVILITFAPHQQTLHIQPQHVHGTSSCSKHG